MSKVTNDMIRKAVEAVLWDTGYYDHGHADMLPHRIHSRQGVHSRSHSRQGYHHGRGTPHHHLMQAGLIGTPGGSRHRIACITPPSLAPLPDHIVTMAPSRATADEAYRPPTCRSSTSRDHVTPRS